MPTEDRVNCITPPYLLEKLIESDDLAVRDAALRTLVVSAEQRGLREATPWSSRDITPEGGRRTIFNTQHQETLAVAKVARSEGQGPVRDPSINRAYDGLGTTRQFYADVFDRDSIDGFGMRLDGYVHFSEGYNNAYWDGRRMVFGDGDGRVFSDLTGSLDVIGHELTHGVTQSTAGLIYHNQSGALNESISDVFGSLIKQWSAKQTAADADWLIGAEVFTPGVGADALRSMKAPGTAYNNALMGKDPQPGHMKDYWALPDTAKGDNGGVHLNSGIPNHAFYLAATAIGGNAWAAPGHIWYESLKATGSTAQFQDFAETTVAKAAQLYGTGGAEHRAVQSAWEQVGIRVAGLLTRSLDASSDDSLAEMSQRIEELAAQVKALTALIRAGANDVKSANTGRKAKARADV